MSTEMFEDTKVFTTDVGLRLSAIARDHADQGKALLIKNANWKEYAAQVAPPADPAVYYDRVLLAFAKQAAFPGEIPAQFPVAPVAARCLLPSRVVVELARQLRDAELVDLRDEDVLRFKVRLTRDGWTKVGELRSQRDASRRSFMAYWFDIEMHPARDAIETVLTAAGYEPPFRVDSPAVDKLPARERTDKIDDRIMSLIHRSRFVVADFTGQRNSVYFEAGYAEGLRIPVIRCCRRSEVALLSFDTRQNEHILWDTPADIAAQLQAKLGRLGLWHGVFPE